jgi:hypothetical protein
MKIKTFLAALLAAGVVTSVALADDPGPVKGSKEQQLLGCRPVVSMIVKGEYVSGSSGSFTMLVTHSNRHARALKDEQVTVTTDKRTRTRRVGGGELQAGDRLVVHGRACRLARGEEPAAALAFLARKVDARAKKPVAAGEGE